MRNRVTRNKVTRNRVTRNRVTRKKITRNSVTRVNGNHREEIRRMKNSEKKRGSPYTDHADEEYIFKVQIVDLYLDQ